MQSPFFGSSCVHIEQHSSPIYERCFGSFNGSDVVPIASATKTLSAAVLMSLVDDGTLSLDDRVGQWLPEWNFGQRALITLRMCFAHTSGLPGGDDAISDDTITLRVAAAQLATLPLQAAPGTEFFYGSVSMHVAGAVCEVASGLSWAQLLAQRIAQPLGMTSTDYYGFGPTPNPRIAGGARTSLADFAKFMNMLRAGGTWNGTQVLSQGAVDTMLLDQTTGTVIASTPHPDQAPYGIGIWLDKQDSQGHTLIASGVGAFGFAGWIDRGRDASGVFFVRYINQQTYPFLRRVIEATEDALVPNGVECLGVGSPACANGTWLNSNSPATAGNLDFEIATSHAPPQALGGLVLGDAAPGGFGVVDLTAFVGPASAFVANMLADGNGRASVAAPLAVGLLGQSFAMQSVWFSGRPCTALGLEASHAVVITVQP